MIKCFPVSNIAVIYYKQAVEFYTNWSGCYQLLWHFILILKINLETGKKVQNYCFKWPVQAYLQSGRGSIVFRKTAHSTGIKVSGRNATTSSQFPTWVLASGHCTHPGKALCPIFIFVLTWGPFSTWKHQIRFRGNFEVLLKTNQTIMILKSESISPFKMLVLTLMCGDFVCVCTTAENKRKLVPFCIFFCGVWIWGRSVPWNRNLFFLREHRNHLAYLVTHSGKAEESFGEFLKILMPKPTTKVQFNSSGNF